MPKTAALRQDLDSLHVARGDFLHPHQLEGDGGALDFQWRRPVLEQFSHSKVPGPMNTFRKPCECSSANSLASKPHCASSAASSPLRAHCPTCSGLTTIPKLPLMLAATETACASAKATSGGQERHSVVRAHDAAEVIVIKGVGGGAVDQRGVKCIRANTSAEHK